MKGISLSRSVSVPKPSRPAGLSRILSLFILYVVLKRHLNTVASLKELHQKSYEQVF